jgi:hypothetical protein
MLLNQGKVYIYEYFAVYFMYLDQKSLIIFISTSNMFVCSKYYANISARTVRMGLQFNLF